MSHEHLIPVNPEFDMAHINSVLDYLKRCVGLVSLVTELQAKQAQLEGSIASLSDQLTGLQLDLEAKNSSIAQLQEELATVYRDRDNAKAEAQGLRETIVARDSRVDELVRERTELVLRNSNQDATILAHQVSMANQQETIDQLTKEVGRLKARLERISAVAEGRDPEPHVFVAEEGPAITGTADERPYRSFASA
jgi:chromosome segregation ATPase